MFMSPKKLVLVSIGLVRGRETWRSDFILQNMPSSLANLNISPLNLMSLSASVITVGDRDDLIGALDVRASLPELFDP